jgi:hypothetical protein
MFTQDLVKAWPAQHRELKPNTAIDNPGVAHALKSIHIRELASTSQTELIEYHDQHLIIDVIANVVFVKMVRVAPRWQRIGRHGRLRF